MSIADNDTTGLARSFGQLHLRIAELEEGGARAPSKAELPAMIEAELRKMRAELDEAKRIELQTHLKLVEERRAREAAEHSLAALKREQAQRDVSDTPLLVVMKKTVADLEAKLRGKDQQLAEAARKLDAAEQRVRGMEACREHAQAAECPVCRAIKLMVLGVPQRASQPGSVPDSIRSVLTAADRPLTAREIGERCDRKADAIAMAVAPMLKRREVVRISVRGIPYTYWLEGRPLPAGEQA